MRVLQKNIIILHLLVDSTWLLSKSNRIRHLVTMVLGGFFELNTFLTVLICSSDNSIKIGLFLISANCFDYSTNSEKNI